MSRRMAYLKNMGYVNEEGVLRHTKLTNFCIPMFGVCAKDFGDSLINAHFLHMNESAEPHLFIIVHNKDNHDEKVVNVLQKLASHSEFIKQYTDDDGAELVYVLRIPNQNLDDYYKILCGDYSQVSNEYKQVLKKFYTNKVYNLNDSPLIINGQVATTMWEILNPSKAKRAIIAKHFETDVANIKELISKPNKRYEIYRTVQELYNEEENICQENQLKNKFKI